MKYSTIKNSSYQNISNLNVDDEIFVATITGNYCKAKVIDIKGNSGTAETEYNYYILEKQNSIWNNVLSIPKYIYYLEE